MKTPLRKPARSKASYTDQYKQEALELSEAAMMGRKIMTVSISRIDSLEIAHLVNSFCNLP